MLIRHSVAWCVLAITLMFAACSKTSTPSAPPTTPPTTPPTNPITTPVTGSLKINLTYPGYTPATNFELIISEPGGNILLDTVAPWSAPVVATLKTNDTLLDVTTVFNSQGGPVYVEVYKSVNPTTFTYFNQYSYVTNTPRMTGTPAEIFYDNIPAAVTTGYTYSPTTSVLMFTNYPYNEFNGTNFDPTDGTLQVYYNNFGGNYAYLLFPQAGLYNLHLQQNASDTVDLTHMDTAIAVTFNRPTPFTINMQDFIFFGFPDTTNKTRIFDFTDILQYYSYPAGVDLEYPGIPMEKYEMYVGARNPENDELGYYYYGNSIPMTLPFPTESNYTLSSTQPDNFTVSFSGSSPTYYRAGYSGANIRLYIFAPPDSSTLHPLSFLTSKNSKLLQNVSFSDMTASQFSVEYDPGFNYAAWITYYNTTALFQQKLLTSSAILYKSLP
jgi:hypothetical protein